MNQIIATETVPQAPAGGGNLDSIHYVHLIKGFTRLFWGLTLTAVLLLSQTRIEFFSGISFPACFLGTMLHCWGLLTLRKAGQISPRWNALIWLALLLAFLEFYFFPFIRWWKMMPYIPFFIFNAAALVVVVVMSLYIINMIAADYFRRLSLKSERREAQVYAGTVVGFMVLPLCAAIIFVFLSAGRYQTLFLDEFVELFHRLPPWVYIVFTVPYSLTLAMLWKARDRSCQQLYLAEKDA